MTASLLAWPGVALQKLAVRRADHALQNLSTWWPEATPSTSGERRDLVPRLERSDADHVTSFFVDHNRHVFAPSFEPLKYCVEFIAAVFF